MIDPNRQPDLLALITHARTVSSEAREAFGTSAAPLVDEPRAILIRTCHRVELYVVGAGNDGDLR